MSNEKSNPDQSVSPEELVGYFEARLSKERAEEIETLIARSDEVAEMARQLGFIGATLDHWTAEAHGLAVRRAHRRVWEARLARLKAKVGAAIVGAIELVMQPPELGSYIVPDVGHLLVEPAYLFAPDIHARGTEDEPILYVQAAEGDLSAHFAVGEDNRVEFSADAGPPGTPPPTLLVYRVEDDDEVLVKEIEPELDVSGDTYYIDFPLDLESHWILLTRSHR